MDDLAIGRKKCRRRPAAKVVATVHVRTFVVVDADRHIPLVDQTDHLRIAVARLVHHVTPVAPDRADREENGLIRDLRFLECLLAPRSPSDLRGAVRAWREPKRHSISSSSILLPNGS